MKIDIKNLIHKYIEESNNPDMLSYGRGFLKNISKKLIYIRNYMELAQIYNATVLDVGCGFGWIDLCISIMGNNKIVANDIRESMISTMNEGVADIKKKLGVKFEIQTLLGDICNIKLEPESFDVVFSHQAIEHCQDLEAMFKNCREALKNKGRLILINDSNWLNKKVRKTTVDMWKKRDESQEFIEKLKIKRPIENKGKEPYRIMREKIIEEADPLISKEEMKKIARATAGLTRKNIECAVELYKKEGKLPVPPKAS